MKELLVEQCSYVREIPTGRDESEVRISSKKDLNDSLVNNDLYMSFVSVIFWALFCLNPQNVEHFTQLRMCYARY